MHKQIYLSVPHMGSLEEVYVKEAFTSNWLSTVGPNVTAFEEEFSKMIGVKSVALSSGTAAIHLGLRLLGVGVGDEVFCPTFTFVATANPIIYLGATPVFLDSELSSWNLDPNLLAETLRAKAKKNRLPKALIVVHLFGQCADMDPITEICREYQIPILEDAAEALGASYKGKLAGTMGDVGTFSFNGNKIITTTSGGMLISPRSDWVEKARFWSTQAKDPGLAYEHSEIGYNYRMSNVLAGIGRGQLQVLEQRVKRRREIAFKYRDAFLDIPELKLMPQADYGLHTNWLSCFLIDEESLSISRDQIIEALKKVNIESRPLWKPMHLQKLYQQTEYYGGTVAERLFLTGICLPSSSNITDQEQEYVIQTVKDLVKKNP